MKAGPPAPSKVPAYFLLFACCALGNPAVAHAADGAAAPPTACEEPVIQGYEPTTLGYTWQGNDEPFVDFRISLKAPLFRRLLCDHLQGRGHLYLTFTGRFAFYVRTRASSPVIDREYNPKILWRFLDTRATTKSIDTYNNKPIEEYARYLDVAYAHSSNGQTIDTQQEYQIESAQSGSARDAMDHISRGWDYLEVDARETVRDVAPGSGDLDIYPDLKFFLRHGLFQGVPEEYHAWERDSTLLPRHAFDGVSMALEYRPFAERIDGQSGSTAAAPRERLLLSLRFELKYTTGYDPFARYNTVRAEIGVAPFGLPIALWFQDGYMNSLARYYEKTSSGGIELRFVQF